MNIANNNFAKPADAPDQVHNRFGLMFRGVVDVLLKVAAQESCEPLGMSSMFLDQNAGSKQHNELLKADHASGA
ncbi:MAG: hypothetical protein KAS93_04240 [Gammaproteobacteria bacterium]|nr:hypothetical protein [Gammaproteobacteria bacterium]